MTKPATPDSQYAFPSYQQTAKGIHGQRPTLLDEIGVDPGWVVKGNMTNDVWKKIHTPAVPIEPGTFNPVHRLKAYRHLTEVRLKYGNDAFFVVVPDEETESGWGGGPVLLRDLDRDPEVLLREGMAAARRDPPDMQLEDMKRRAYLMVTGMRDTK